MELHVVEFFLTSMGWLLVDSELQSWLTFALGIA